jgi:hypothetical protein
LPNAGTWTISSSGRYAEAEPLYRRSLAIDEKGLGAEHPNPVRVRENYTTLFEKIDVQTQEDVTGTE